MPNSDDPEPSLLDRLTAFFRRKTKKRRSDNDQNLRESIEELIDEHTGEGNPIAHDERELLGNVLDLRELTAEDVMVPRADIISIPSDISEEALLDTFVRSRLQRIPVFRDTLDEVKGIVQIQDVLAWKISGAPLEMKTLIREVLFISPTMRTLDLMFQMRERGIRMALVVDEFGGVDGLVTFSDLMEEIIGDIQEAHDHRDPELIVRADGSIAADGRVDLEQLQEVHDLDLLVPDLEDEVETIGGLVSTLAGHVPVRGEIIKHPTQNVEFEVLDADPRRVKRVLIKRV